MKMLLKIYLCLSCLLLLFPLGAENLLPDKGVAAGEMRYAYVFGLNGEFLKIDVCDNAIAAYWSLTRVEGLVQVVPPIPDNPMDSWFIDDAKYSPSAGRLYLVAPVKVAESQVVGWKVLVLGLPTLSLKGEILLADNIDGTPRLLVSPDGNKIYINYTQVVLSDTGEINQYTDVIDSYDTSTLKKMDSIQDKQNPNAAERGKKAITVYFSSAAYFGTDGQTIFDKDSICTLQGNKFGRTFIKPLELLNARQRTQVLDFLSPQGKANPANLFINVVDSAAGKFLVRFADKQGLKKGMFILDPAKKEISPLVEVTSISTTWLTRDGKQVILEVVQDPKTPSDNTDKSKIYKTGFMQVYDMTAGKKIQDLSYPEIFAGAESDHRIVCLAPDTGKMLYLSGSNLFLIDFVKNTSPIRLDTAFSAKQASVCVFADQ